METATKSNIHKFGATFLHRRKIFADDQIKGFNKLIIETGSVFLQYVPVFPAPGECMSLAQHCKFTGQITSELLSYASLTTNIATAILFFFFF